MNYTELAIIYIVDSSISLIRSGLKIGLKKGE
jgi:hypothetical protein